MPADLDDGRGSDASDSSEGQCVKPLPGPPQHGFNAAAWLPEGREYGIYNLLICRDGVPEAEKPDEIATLKVVSTSLCSFPAVPPARRRGNGAAAANSDDEDYISEGEHGEPTASASWSGRPRSWWRVHNQLGEEMIVREGVSLRSAQLRRVSPGELVQQAGLARSLTQGNAKGCIRLPVRPTGWVTADATKAGGPKYLVRASVPRWRVVCSTPADGARGKEGSVIVREDEELNSEEVTSLHRGDVVEQAGLSITRADGIIRMPVTTTVLRRSDLENGEAEVGGHNGRATASGKTLGWVTVDATAAGGPVFFKPVAETDRGEKHQQHQQHYQQHYQNHAPQHQQHQQQQPRRRRPKQAA